MDVTVFHGSPRKGNTFTSTTIFTDELQKLGNVNITEFYLPKAMPEFCTGCQKCLGNPNNSCPHTEYVMPVLTSILKSEAVIFATPHFACNMSGAMKNLIGPIKHFYQKLQIKTLLSKHFLSANRKYAIIMMEMLLRHAEEACE